MFYPIDFKNYNKGTEIKSNKSDNRLKNIFFFFLHIITMLPGKYMSLIIINYNNNSLWMSLGAGASGLGLPVTIPVLAGRWGCKPADPTSSKTKSKA